jgi:hypothetical protein
VAGVLAAAATVFGAAGVAAVAGLAPAGLVARAEPAAIAARLAVPTSAVTVTSDFRHRRAPASSDRLHHIIVVFGSARRLLEDLAGGAESD